MEIITAPDINNSKDAMEFVRQLLAVLRAVDTCDGQLAGTFLTSHALHMHMIAQSEGSLRVDANISLRPVGAAKFGVRTEVKNINGLKYLAKAIGLHLHNSHNIVSSSIYHSQTSRLHVRRLCCKQAVW